jgi:hypothetical protein
VARIAGLACYPVKGCRGVQLGDARVVETGLEWDRQWMVVGEDGRFISQRTHPKLAVVVPTITADALMLDAPGRPTLRVPLEGERAFRRVVVWHDWCEAGDEGDVAAHWLDDVLGEGGVRLVRASPGMRHANRMWTGELTAPVTFADGFPVLVTSLASLEWLNARLPEPVPMDRFRANVVIEGLEAFDEDRIADITVGRITLRFVKPCTRCTVPSIDQLTGEKGVDPVAALRPTRFDRALKGITFGENAAIVAGTGGRLAIGDDVQVTFDH